MIDGVVLVVVPLYMRFNNYYYKGELYLINSCLVTAGQRRCWTNIESFFSSMDSKFLCSYNSSEIPSFNIYFVYNLCKILHQMRKFLLL